MSDKHPVIGKIEELRATGKPTALADSLLREAVTVQTVADLRAELRRREEEIEGLKAKYEGTNATESLEYLRGFNERTDDLLELKGRVAAAEKRVGELEEKYCDWSVNDRDKVKVAIAVSPKGWVVKRDEADIEHRWSRYNEDGQRILYAVRRALEQEDDDGNSVSQRPSAPRKAASKPKAPSKQKPPREPVYSPTEGEPTVRFGHYGIKGKPVSELSQDDLEWYVEMMGKHAKNPKEERYREGNIADAIELAEFVVNNDEACEVSLKCAAMTAKILSPGFGDAY